MTVVHATLSGLILNYIHQMYGGRPHAAKRLAIITESEPRTAENWLARLNAPSGERLVALLAAHPDLEAQFIEHIAARRRLRAASTAAATFSLQRLAARR